MELERHKLQQLDLDHSEIQGDKREVMVSCLECEETEVLCMVSHDWFALLHVFFFFVLLQD